MSDLGRMGRFGNQVFQYSFLRIAAGIAGARVECAPWAGHHLFGHDDPPVSAELTPLIERDQNGNSLFDVIPEFVGYLERAKGTRSGTVTPDALRKGASGGDLYGFFLNHTRNLRPHRDFFRSLFEPLPDMHDWLHEPLELLGQQGKTIVAIHLRAGDYKWLPQLGYTLSTPPRWWVEWLDANWSTLDDPVLFICSDRLGEVKGGFRKYNPVTADDLRLDPPDRLKGMDFGYYRDFFALTQADVLGISNSSFSFAAAMLNDRGTKFVRPVWDLEKRFEAFDPWDAEPLLFVEGGNGRYLKDFRSALRVARATGGVPGMLATALVYYPAGVMKVAGIRRHLRRN